MRKGWILCIGSAVLGALTAMICTRPPHQETAVGQELRRGPGLETEFGSATPSGAFTPQELVNIGVYDQANRGVVHITTRTVVQDFFFETPKEGAGSGSVLDQRGHILTNYHVIADAQRIRVTLFNNREFDAVLVGQDALTDVAVLRIEAPRDMLFPIALGDSGQLRVGQHVFAIGNPFGLERTMTTGIISSLNRTLPAKNKRLMKSIIQIDAALNQGNSGGPLLDSRARLIGMNTAIASSTGENTGVGFAIPANTISRVVPQLIERGRVVRPEVGITYMVQTQRGPAIVAVTPGGPAEKVGLQGFRVVRKQTRRGPFVYEESHIDRDSADVILSVDGVRVETVDDFTSEIENKRPGQEITLEILRGGQPLAVRMVLGGAQ